MKNFLLLAFLAVTVCMACKKNNSAPVAAAANPLSLEDALVSRSGNLVFTAKGATGGLVKIYQQKNGSYVLALEQLDYSSPFDMNVYFSAIPGLNPASIKLFSAKNFNGNIYYALPAGINIDAFRYLVIQNDTSDQPAAIAELGK